MAWYERLFLKRSGHFSEKRSQKTNSDTVAVSCSALSAAASVAAGVAASVAIYGGKHGVQTDEAESLSVLITSGGSRKRARQLVAQVLGNGTK